MRLAAAVGAVSLLATATLAACGADPALDRRETIETTGAICGDATRQARLFAIKNAPASSPAAISRAIEEDVRIARQVERRLTKLELADDARRGFDPLVAAQRRIVKANTDQLAASRAGDPARFRASVDALLAATRESKRAADSYGLEGCPYLPVSVQLERRSARQARREG